MKEKEPVSLSRMAAMSVGLLAYQPEPDAEAPAIPPAHEPCDYSIGGQARNGFLNPFPDLDAPRKSQQVSVGVLQAFARVYVRGLLSKDE
jgi:hypothetical protein